jgi:hypothetical protein
MEFCAAIAGRVRVNREYAAKIGLRQFNKPFKVCMPGYRHGLVINTIDRQYEVIGPSWHFVQWLSLGDHEFPAIIRDTRHISKPYPIKHPAVISDKARELNPPQNGSIA